MHTRHHHNPCPLRVLHTPLALGHHITPDRRRCAGALHVHHRTPAVQAPHNRCVCTARPPHTRHTHTFRFQASPDELAGVGESSRAHTGGAAPRAANPGAGVASMLPGAGPSALDSLVDIVAREEGGDGSDLSSPTQGLRPLDQNNRRSRRNSREVTGLDAVPETTAGVVGGDATPLAALAPSPLPGPSPLPAIRTGGTPPKPVSST